MNYRFGNTIVIALGGSVVYPGEIDVAFLRRFEKFARVIIRKKRKLVLVVGGGRLARLFQNAAEKVLRLRDEDKDWIGVYATRLNARLIQAVFRGAADPVLIERRARERKLRYPITIASGWRPGWSTDYVAVRLAADFRAHAVVIAGKPSYVYPRTKRESRKRRNNPRSGVGVYDKDHEILDTEHPFKALSWREYQRLVPKKWNPGLHAPVDPVAARLAERKGIAAIIIHGKNLKNFTRLLNGKEFRGTIIT